MPIEFICDQAQVVPGIRCSSMAAGIKVKNRLDLVLFDLGDQATSACVTTQNQIPASPVLLTRKHRAQAIGRYWLVNTGYANAAMGKAGELAALRVCQALSETLKQPIDTIWPFSTGVIGEPLPVERIVPALPQLAASLAEDQWQQASQGIVTTDTQYKLVSKTFVWQEQAFIVQGVAKGAGMIKPNMATMLGFIGTDIGIPQSLIEGMLQEAVAKSFNAISVDSDTSTNDCVAFGSSNQSQLKCEVGTELAAFVQSCLNDVCLSLAMQVIKDGEGATKLIEIEVRGARSVDDARLVAESIGHSPLVKTACFASDPNWGRILMAIGKVSQVEIDQNNLSVSLCGALLFTDAGRVADYDEAVFVEKMQGQHLLIEVDLHQGQSKFTFYTNDLSYEYVKINADYRS